ncbi:MAG: thiamine-phosphate kinase [Nitrospirae bacterium]|nr:MAG: thiamine-phosphate kinase [Nitrospirota bacterium]
MRLSQWGELALLEELKRRFPAGRDVPIGIGDDTAVLNLTENTLITTDTFTENIHFIRSLFTPFQIGYRLVASSVSDIYAMGGRAGFMLLNMSMPSDTEKAFVDGFLDGLETAINEHGLCLVGGDVTASEALMTFTATVLGVCTERVITRSGATPGDFIYLSAPTGEAMAGLELLKRIGFPLEVEKNSLPDIGLERDHALRVLKRLLLPEVHPLKDCSALTAMIDVSDGLFIDLKRLCDASGVGARIYEESLPLTDALREVTSYLGIEPYRLITSGGEDYVLLFTSSSELKGYYRIGEIVKEAEGVSVVRRDGSLENIGYRGYEHFVHKG